MLHLDPDARRTPQHEPLVLSRGCGEMFSAVITLTYSDLWAPDANAKQGRDQAYLLLTQPRGQWADHRTFLCDQCGVNGQKLRDFIWEQLEGVRDPIVRSGTHDQMGLQAGISVFTQAQIDETREFHKAQLDRVNNAARKRTQLAGARRSREEQERLERQAWDERGQQRVMEVQQRGSSSSILDDWFANMTAEA